MMLLEISLHVSIFGSRINVVSSDLTFFQVGESVPIEDNIFKGEHERVVSCREKPLIQVVESYDFAH